MDPIVHEKDSRPSIWSTSAENFQGHQKVVGEVLSSAQLELAQEEKFANMSVLKIGQPSVADFMLGISGVCPRRDQGGRCTQNGGVG